METQAWLAPAALYIARDALGGGLAALTSELRDREQGEALQRDFSETGLTPQHGEPLWLAWGNPLWLVGTTPKMPSGDALVLAVRAPAALAAAFPQARLSAAGESLSGGFSGVRVDIPASKTARYPSRILFVWIAVALATIAAAGSLLLLWRDIHRELRMSALRTQFIASVSHELRTPLAAIRMFAETLKLDADTDAACRGEYLDTILNESERLSRLVDNVLGFSRIEQGKARYHLAPVRLNDVVESAVRAIEYPLAQSGFHLEVKCQPNLPEVRADKDALQQAILNLLANAMKYSGDSRDIILSAEHRDSTIVISVTDHGIGMHSEDRKRIFERFYRAPVLENQSIPGAGLGLTLVDHIVRFHGGAVDVTSEPGDGSTFTVRLPITPGMEATRRA